MKMIAVVSTSLRTVGYDPDRRLLQIEFQDRSVYQYFEVPPIVYEELLEAKSKGTQFNRAIRQRFNHVQIRAPSLS